MSLEETNTETATPETTTTTTQPSGGESGATETTLESSGAPNAPPPAYVPNFKYRVVDDQLKRDVEKEFDEWARPLVTKKDVEDKIRELYTKAHGIDHIKSARDRFRTEAESRGGELGTLKNSLSQLSTYIQKDDLNSFFNTLRIPEEKVLKYALERVNYHNLPPEKKAEYDQALDTRSRATLLAEDNHRLQQESLRTQALLRDQELSQVTQSPEVRSIAEAYDQRIGTPGAFREQCIRRGAYYFQVHQKDVPASVIAQEVAQEIQKLIGQTAVTPPMVAQPGVPDQTEMQTQPDKKPIIPNIQGKGTSPAKKMPRSIEDLKKLRREA